MSSLKNQSLLLATHAPVNNQFFQTLTREVSDRQHRSHVAAQDDDLAQIEVRRGIEFTSGVLVVRHDEVWLRDVLIGKYQYKALQHVGIGENDEPEMSISEAGAGTQPGRQPEWLINEAKGALLFVKPEEIEAAFDFNEQRRGEPVERRIARQAQLRAV